MTKTTGKKEKSTGKKEKSTGKKEHSSGKKEHSFGKKEHSFGKKENLHGKKEKSSGKKQKSAKTVILPAAEKLPQQPQHKSTHSSSVNSSSSLDSSGPSTVLDEISSVVGGSVVHSKTCSPAHHHSPAHNHNQVHKTPDQAHHGGGGGGGPGSHHPSHSGQQHNHHHHSPHASHVPSMDIANMQRNVPHRSRIVASSDGKSKVSTRSRVRHDPRADPRPNENLPIEASADNLVDSSCLSREQLMEDCLEPTLLYDDDVRHEFHNDTMAVLIGSDIDPEKYLKKVVESEVVDNSYLSRHVDPHKLIDFIINHMENYYDTSKDSNPLSEKRQHMDNVLWDTLAYLIPMLCRDTADVLKKEPMIITEVEPSALIFGDLHGNANDLYYIYKHFIVDKKYANHRFIFLGDYVDRGPKPVEILCLLFSLKLSDPKRFILLRGNHEVYKVNRKYGFLQICLHMFLDTFITKPTLAQLNYMCFNRAFCFLSVGAVIKGPPDRSIFCCHGGVPNSALKDDERSSGWKVDRLNTLVIKPASLAPTKKARRQVLALNEILWNDPLPLKQRRKIKYRGKKNFFKNKKRGGHCSFFNEVGLEKFLEANHLQMVVRGHQYKNCKETGFMADYGNRLMTVFSSSNYCGSEQNTTGYIEVIGKDCQVKPHVLRNYSESGKFKEFNLLKIITDKKTKQVTHVAF